MNTLSDQKFTLVIPACNEVDIIAQTVDLIVTVFEAKSPILWNIIVVDNLSTDGTARVIENMKDTRVSVIRLKERGKGRALRAGFAQARSMNRGGVVGFTDADLPIHPDYILSALDMVLNGSTEVVVGTRFAKTSNMESRTPARRLSSYIFHMLAKYIVGIDKTDSQCPLKIMNERVAQVMEATTDSTWWADLEFVALLNRLHISIAQIPVIWNEDRYAGRKSTLAIVGDGMKAVRAMFSLRISLPIVLTKLRSAGF